MATEAQIAAAVEELIALQRTEIEAVVRTVAQRLEGSPGNTDTAKPCEEILGAIAEAQQILGEVGDSQGRTIGVTLMRRAFRSESRCRAAVKSLRALIEDA